MSRLQSRRALAALAFVSPVFTQLGCLAEPFEPGAVATDDAPITESAQAISYSSPVRIEDAAYFSMSHYGQTWDNSLFRVSLTNLDYTKSVAIVAQSSNGSWFELPASYERSAGNNQEIWGAYTNTKVVQFAVRYTVLGQTYWDNNSGSNYQLVGTGHNLYNNINVLASKLSTLSGGSTTLGVWAYVRNLAYGKQVNVTYTTDGWQTVQNAALGYQNRDYYGYGSAPSPNEAGVELWGGSINVGNAQTVEYAVSYAVNGATYWDNNHGMNYVVVRQ